MKAGGSLRRRFRTAFVAGFFFFPVAALSGVWTSDANLPLTVESARNPGLVEGEDKLVRITSMVPKYGLSWVEGRERLHSQVSVLIERSSEGQENYDRNDPAVSVGWQHRTSKGSFNTGVNYEEVAIRTAELRESGLVGIDGTRRNQFVFVDWARSLTKLTTIGFNGGYRVANYDTAHLTDYKQRTAALNVDRVFDSRTTGSAQLAAEQYRPKRGAGGEASDLYTLNIGVNRKATERLEWSINGGGYRNTGANGSSGWNGSGMLDYRIAGGKVGLGFERSVTTSAYSGFLETDRLEFSIDHRISDKGTIGINLGRREMRTSDVELLNEVNVFATHRYGRSFDAKVFFQLSHREGSTSGTADGNHLGMTLSYFTTIR